MKNKGNTLPKAILPEGSKRITNEAGDRVWLINGKEFLSKAEYFQWLQDLFLASKTDSKVHKAVENALQVPSGTDGKPIPNVIFPNVISADKVST